MCLGSYSLEIYTKYRGIILSFSIVGAYTLIGSKSQFLMKILFKY